MNERPALAPTLETQRLVLRPHHAEDFADCVAMWRDPQVVRYTIGSESSPERTWQRLLTYHGLWSLFGFGYWAVQRKSDGRYIGELGFADFHRQFSPSIDGMPEIGWALITQAHGQGFASEALQTVVAWGDRNIKNARTVCIIHRDNAASIRLARKLGYLTELRAATNEHPQLLLCRERRH
jgi:RimJ/RimL family protein N-acetyltransferase